MTSRYSEALEQHRNLASWMRSDWAVQHYKRGSMGNVPLPMAAEYTEILAKNLARVPTFFCSAEIKEMISATCISMPEWYVTRENVPAPGGFCWLEEPFYMPTENQPIIITGVYWLILLERETPAIILGFLIRTGDRYAGMPVDWAFTWGDDPAKKLGAESPIRFTGALFAFMQQQILLSQQETADKSAQHKQRKSPLFKQSPEVQVIYLRRPRSAKTDASEPQEWSCQWIVTGHWRKQWYPKSQKHQPVWISPYVKGDPDKPLKPSSAARVYAVVR